VKYATRPAIFKWRQTAPELILCAVRWYLRYSLSLRDVEELFAERGLEADHRTIWRWGNVTVPNWNSGCAAISSRPTNPGVSMRPIFE
jgi:transposase-like protein